MWCPRTVLKEGDLVWLYDDHPDLHCWVVPAFPILCEVTELPEEGGSFNVRLEVKVDSLPKVPGATVAAGGVQWCRRENIQPCVHQGDIWIFPETGEHYIAANPRMLVSIHTGEVLARSERNITEFLYNKQACLLRRCKHKHEGKT